jgi:hypothetical protein
MIQPQGKNSTATTNQGKQSAPTTCSSVALFGKKHGEDATAGAAAMALLPA